MSLARRLALLEWAHATGAAIFEDDYDSEYRYSGRPLPALQGLDRHGQVLFAGSPDAVSLVRWKDIHEQLEEAVDACENAADVLEAILVKNR